MGSTAATSRSDPGTSTNATKKTTDGEILEWWHQKLDDAQRTILSYASDDALYRAMIDVRKGNIGKEDAWRKMPEAAKDEAVSKPFLSALEATFAPAPAADKPHLRTDDETFRGIAASDCAIIAADAISNAFRRDITATQGTSDHEFFPSIVTAEGYLANTCQKKEYQNGLNEEKMEIYKSYGPTRVMIEILSTHCSSTEDVRQIVNSSHCPSGWKDEKTGLLALHSWIENLKDRSLFTESKVVWDTTRHDPWEYVTPDGKKITVRSAMRPPQDFPRFGKPPLPRDEVLRRKARETSSDGGRLTTNNGIGVTFDPSASSNSGLRKLYSRALAHKPSWMSRSNSSKSAKAATGTITEGATTLPPSDTATSSPSAPSAPSEPATTDSSPAQAQPSTTQTARSAPTTTSSGVSSPWAQPARPHEIPASKASPHFGFSPNVPSSTVTPAQSTTATSTTSGAPFRGTYKPGTLSRKSSLASTNSQAKPKKGVRFGGIAGKSDSTSANKRSTLSKFNPFSKRSKVDGAMIPSSARSCMKPTGTSFSSLPGTAMT